jgi:very-short-patch-repair endonuclease
MLPQNKNLKQFARKLRNNATRQENRLWYEYLRNYPMQFNRQMIILNYIADFYCAKARLVIELDGSQHYSHEGLTRDAARTEVLSTMGLEVLRFTNLDIEQNLTGVCEEINRVVLRRAGQPTLSENEP